MIVKINIDQHHIDDGVRHSCMNCPIALAFEEKGFSVRINEGYAIIGRARYKLPEVARDFIDAFDSKKPVEPLAFEVTI